MPALRRRGKQSIRICTDFILWQTFLHSNRVIQSVQAQERSSNGKQARRTGSRTVVLVHSSEAKHFSSDLVIKLAHCAYIALDLRDVDDTGVREDVDVFKKEFLEVSTHHVTIDMLANKATFDG